MSTMIENAVCSFCGCLCDDIVVEVEDGKINRVRKVCANGRGLFDHYDPTPRLPTVDGQEVGWEEAVAEAARVLNEADSPLIYGLSSLPSGKERLSKASVPIFPEGLISGIPGVLLNEGKKRDFEVTCLLAEARDKIPDARAAARILETMKGIIPYFNIDLTPLYAEADLLEAKLKGMQAISKPGGKKTGPNLPMYG